MKCERIGRSASSIAVSHRRSGATVRTAEIFQDRPSRLAEHKAHQNFYKISLSAVALTVKHAGGWVSKHVIGVLKRCTARQTDKRRGQQPGQPGVLLRIARARLSFSNR